MLNTADLHDCARLIRDIEVSNEALAQLDVFLSDALNEMTGNEALFASLEIAKSHALGEKLASLNALATFDFPTLEDVRAIRALGIPLEGVRITDTFIAARAGSRIGY